MLKELHHARGHDLPAPRARGDCVSAANSPISSIGVRILNRIGSSAFASSDPIRKLPPLINGMLTIREPRTQLPEAMLFSRGLSRTGFWLGEMPRVREPDAPRRSALAEGDSHSEFRPEG